MARPNTANQTARFAPEVIDNARLANLCGAVDRNLRFVESLLDVRIVRRGGDFSIEGEGRGPEMAAALLARFYDRATEPVLTEDIQLASISLNRGARRGESEPVETSAAEPADDDQPVLRTRKGELRGRTDNQARYLRQILNHDITFGIGPAGTGKTYLAVACAADALERDAVQRIILTRPAVEAGERLGFLPGDLTQKVDPYLRPLYDALNELIGYERVVRLIEKQSIEIAPLAYMRGRTLSNSFIILDEAQNTTPEQMKMFLTRVGFGSKAVVTGDVTQIDLPKHQPSGLVQAEKILRKVRGIAFTEFDSADVVRHPLVARIVDAYDKHARASGERH